MSGIFKWTTICTALIVVLSTEAQSSINFSVEEPRIYSIQNRSPQPGHEFRAGLGVMPLNAFYVGLVGQASYTYHFSNLWAWDILDLHYSVNLDTPLNDKILNEHGVQPKDGGDERIEAFATTNLVIKPLYGKIAFFNHTQLRGEALITLGLGPFMSTDGRGKERFVDLAAAFGVGLRVWNFDRFSFRFDVTNHLIFKNMFGFVDTRTRSAGGVEATLLFGLSFCLHLPKHEGAPEHPRRLGDD